MESSRMERSIDPLSDVVPGRESWRIKVRVVRIWEVPSFLKPGEANSLELVLIDDKGTKIHAVVKKQLLYVFQRKFKEGDAYTISFFSVTPSTGNYRPALHPFKIFFQLKTKVQSLTSVLIPRLGFSFTPIVDVCNHSVEFEYLVDVIGLITGMSEEKDYVRDGKVTKMIILELTDHSGKVECALFGEYVDLLKSMMGEKLDGLRVLIIQFAKIKIFRDKVSLQNVKSTTRIFLDLDVPEALSFKNGIPGIDVQSSAPVPLMMGRSKPSLEDEFLSMYPKKTLSQLAESVDDGVFVVNAVVSGFVDGDDWWYPACKCHRGVTRDSGSYYCNGCVKHVSHMVPRYRLKLRVEDGTGDAVFVLFDNDVLYLVEKQCSVLVSKAKCENSRDYPPELVVLKGRRILFKVGKTSTVSPIFDDSFKVKRVCKDQSVIDRFVLDGVDYTPTKAAKSSVVDVEGKLKSARCPDDVSDGAVDSDDDSDFVDDTQHFLDELIISPSPGRGRSGIVQDDIGTTKRDLNVAFEGVSDEDDENPPKRPKIESD